MIIFYGICGEGLGHTGRSIAIINELKKQHEVIVFTFGQAFEYLKKEKLDNLNEIPGLALVAKENKADLKQTLKNCWKFKKQIPTVVDLIAASFPKPDLCITDFEPIVPRIAIAHNILCISIDNQHKLTLSSKGLPLVLKLYSSIAKRFINWFIPETDFNIITTFHKCEKCTNLVNIIVRKELTEIVPYPQPFVLVYFKDYLETKILDTLKQIPEENFIIYGSSKTENYENLIFKKPSNTEFAQDLANCKKVICTAGNQLIGEAKYFRKPVFVIPVDHQTEQFLNAWYVKKELIGTYSKIKSLSPQKIKMFLETEYYLPPVPNGLDEVMNMLKPYLD
jgi:uncharacterized protein (TIGR00661 family)